MDTYHRYWLEKIIWNVNKRAGYRKYDIEQRTELGSLILLDRDGEAATCVGIDASGTHYTDNELRG